MKIALTDVLPGGRAGPTVVHLNEPTLEDRIVTALGVPKEFLYGQDEDDGTDDR